MCLGPAGFALLETFSAAVDRTKINNLQAVDPDRFTARKQPCDELTVEIGVARIAVREDQEDSRRAAIDKSSNRRFFFRRRSFYFRLFPCAGTAFGSYFGFGVVGMGALTLARQPFIASYNRLSSCGCDSTRFFDSPMSFFRL